MVSLWYFMSPLFTMKAFCSIHHISLVFVCLLIQGELTFFFFIQSKMAQYVALPLHTSMVTCLSQYLHHYSIQSVLSMSYGFPLGPPVSSHLPKVSVNHEWICQYVYTLNPAMEWSRVYLCFAPKINTVYECTEQFYVVLINTNII